MHFTAGNQYKTLKTNDFSPFKCKFIRICVISQIFQVIQVLSMSISLANISFLNIARQFQKIQFAKGTTNSFVQRFVILFTKRNCDAQNLQKINFAAKSECWTYVGRNRIDVRRSYTISISMELIVFNFIHFRVLKVIFAPSFPLLLLIFHFIWVYFLLICRECNRPSI